MINRRQMLCGLAAATLVPVLPLKAAGADELNSLERQMVSSFISQIQRKIEKYVYFKDWFSLEARVCEDYLLHRFRSVGFYGYISVYDKLSYQNLKLEEKVMIWSLSDAIDIGASVNVPRSLQAANNISITKVLKAAETELKKVARYDEDAAKGITAFYKRTVVPLLNAQRTKQC